MWDEAMKELNRLRSSEDVAGREQLQWRITIDLGRGRYEDVVQTATSVVHRAEKSKCPSPLLTPSKDVMIWR
jgi:hypothetical protein